MATKPSTIPRVWASSALYTNGPFIGDVMKVDPGAGIAAAGHRPGASFPTAAEHENFQQNLAPGVCSATKPGGYCDPNGDGAYFDGDFTKGNMEHSAKCG